MPLTNQELNSLLGDTSSEPPSNSGLSKGDMDALLAETLGGASSATPQEMQAAGAGVSLPEYSPETSWAKALSERTGRNISPADIEKKHPGYSAKGHLTEELASTREGRLSAAAGAYKGDNVWDVDGTLFVEKGGKFYMTDPPGLQGADIGGLAPTAASIALEALLLKGAGRVGAAGATGLTKNVLRTGAHILRDASISGGAATAEMAGREALSSAMSGREADYKGAVEENQDIIGLSSALSGIMRLGADAASGIRHSVTGSAQQHEALENALRRTGFSSDDMTIDAQTDNPIFGRFGMQQRAVSNTMRDADRALAAESQQQLAPATGGSLKAQQSRADVIGRAIEETYEKNWKAIVRGSRPLKETYKGDLGEAVSGSITRKTNAVKGNVDALYHNVRRQIGDAVYDLTGASGGPSAKAAADLAETASVIKRGVQGRVPVESLDDVAEGFRELMGDAAAPWTEKKIVAYNAQLTRIADLLSDPQKLASVEQPFETLVNLRSMLLQMSNMASVTGRNVDQGLAKKLAGNLTEVIMNPSNMDDAKMILWRKAARSRVALQDLYDLDVRFKIATASDPGRAALNMVDASNPEQIKNLRFALDDKGFNDLKAAWQTELWREGFGADGPERIMEVVTALKKNPESAKLLLPGGDGFLPKIEQYAMRLTKLRDGLVTPKALQTAWAGASLVDNILSTAKDAKIMSDVIEGVGGVGSPGHKALQDSFLFKMVMDSMKADKFNTYRPNPEMFMSNMDKWLQPGKRDILNALFSNDMATIQRLKDVSVLNKALASVGGGGGDAGTSLIVAQDVADLMKLMRGEVVTASKAAFDLAARTRMAAMSNSGWFKRMLIERSGKKLDPMSMQLISSSVVRAGSEISEGYDDLDKFLQTGVLQSASGM